MLILETDRLRLRWFHDTASDADFLRALLNDPGWLANIGERNVRTRRQARHWIATRHTAVYGRLGFGFWAVERKSDGALMGMCGLIKRDTLDDIDLGFAFLARAWGHGYAIESARAVLQHACDVLNIRRLVAILSPDNDPSARLLHKLGFRFERMVRLADDGEDLAMHAITLADARVAAE